MTGLTRMLMYWCLFVKQSLGLLYYRVVNTSRDCLSMVLQLFSSRKHRSASIVMCIRKSNPPFTKLCQTISELPSLYGEHFCREGNQLFFLHPPLGKISTDLRHKCREHIKHE